MFLKIIFWEYTFVAIFTVHTNTKILTELSFRAGNIYSALWSITLGSLLGWEQRIFPKLESLSHMMPWCF